MLARAWLLLTKHPALSPHSTLKMQGIFSTQQTVLNLHSLQACLLPRSCSRPLHCLQTSNRTQWQAHQRLPLKVQSSAGVAERVTQQQPYHQQQLQQQESTSNFTHNLSEEQAAAALAGDGHLRIIAGPGSGKTRVLTSRVEYLIKEKGCKPWELVVITFSNKAAKELQDRLDKLLGPALATKVVTGTFHSVGCQITRRYVNELGDTGREGFTIFDQDDSKAAMKKALQQLFSRRKGKVDNIVATVLKDAEGSKTTSAEKLDAPEWEQPKNLDKLAKHFRHSISLLKNGVSTCYGLTGKAALAKYNAGSAALVNSLDRELQLAVRAGVTLEQAFDLYEAELRQNRGLDFDDLLSWPVALLQQSETVRERLQKRYKHILVDEFQDTNAPQYELVRQLAGSQANVFVVGDPDQAIYGWRGANVINMQQSFTSDYPGAQTLHLKDNYRSTPQVLRGAEGVLTHIVKSGTMPERVDLNPLLSSGPQIEVAQVSNERAEAEAVAVHIQQIHAQGRLRWGDMAILYRTNAQSRLFEEQLMKRSIPFVVVGGQPFWSRKEVKDVMAYIKLAVNPEDNLSLMRILNYPTRGIGNESQVKLQKWAEAQHKTLGQALFPDYQATAMSYQSVVPEVAEESYRLPAWPDPAQVQATCDLPVKELGLSKKAAEGVHSFCKTIMMFRAMLMQHSLAPVLERMLQHIKLEDFLMSVKSDKERQQDRWGNIEQVLGAAEHVTTQPSVRGLDYLDSDNPMQEAKSGLAQVQSFLEQVALWSEPEKAAAEDDKQEKANVVNVMTLHASKGLEFAVVYIVGCEESLMPLGGMPEDLSDPGDLESFNEEVRLLYVGMTRAKHQLLLLHARQRALRGGRNRFYAKPSPFLLSIPGQESTSQPTQIDSGSYRSQPHQSYDRHTPRSSQSSSSYKSQENGRSYSSSASYSNSNSRGSSSASKSSSSARQKPSSGVKLPSHVPATTAADRKAARRQQMR